MRGLYFLLALLCFFSACGGGSSTTNSSSDEGSASLESTASGVASVFAAFSSATVASISANVSRFVEDGGDTVCDHLESGPAKVITVGSGFADTFGSATAGITITQADYCTDDDGSTFEGDAETVDGQRFAFFSFLTDIAGECTEDSDTTDLTLSRGMGVVRRNDASETEIYGQFENGDDIINCTLIMDVDNVLDTEQSSCTDSNDAEVALSSTTSCTMDASIERMEVPESIEGHYAVSADEGQSVAYDCFAMFPSSMDDDDFIAYSSDCSTFATYGFNLTSFNAGIVVSGDESDWTFNFTGGTREQLANRIRIMRNLGYPILFSIDLLYAENYDPDDTSSVSDGTDFSQSMIDNEEFQADLTAEIVELATMAEKLGVEIFAPLSEADRVLGSSNEDYITAIYLQSILDDIEAVYTGDLMWIAQFYNNTDTELEYNLEGFDYAGVNISPQPSDNAETFPDHLDEQLSNMKVIADTFGIPYLISNAGMWGSALDDTQAYDWDATPERVLETFQMMKDQSDAYGTAGIIFWEGATGEVDFGDYPDLGTYMAQEFGGDPDSF